MDLIEKRIRASSGYDFDEFDDSNGYHYQFERMSPMYVGGTRVVPGNFSEKVLMKRVENKCLLVREVGKFGYRFFCIKAGQIVLASVITKHVALDSIVSCTSSEKKVLTVEHGDHERLMLKFGSDLDMRGVQSFLAAVVKRNRLELELR